MQRIAVGKQPEGVSVRPDGAVVYVTCEEDDIVVAIDAAKGQVLARIPTGKRPRSLAFAQDGATAFVTNELGTSLTVIDTATQTPARHAAARAAEARARARWARSLAPDGKHLYVSTGRGGAVAVVDVAARKLERVIASVGARPWGHRAQCRWQAPLHGERPVQRSVHHRLEHGRNPAREDRRLALGCSEQAIGGMPTCAARTQGAR